MTDVELLADEALARGIRIAVAESLTSGALATTLGRGHDASTWFAGAIVAYGTDVKVRVLGVPDDVDPCSAECAEQLAVGARELMRADIAISATGVGGPDAEGGHPPGTVYVGWATGGVPGHRLLHLSGEPADVLAATVAHCVSLLGELVRQAPHSGRG